MKRVACALKGTIAVQRLMGSARWAVKLDGWEKLAVIKENMAIDVMKLAASVLEATTAVQLLMDSAMSDVKLDGKEKLVNRDVIKDHTATDAMNLVACVLTATTAVQLLMEGAMSAAKLDGEEKSANKVAITVHMATDAMKLVACVTTATYSVQQLMDIAYLIVTLDGEEKLVNMVAIKEHTATDVMKHVACVSAAITAAQRLMECARLDVKLDGGEEHASWATTTVQRLTGSASPGVMQDGVEKLVNKTAIKEHTATDAIKRVACVLVATTAVQRLMDSAMSGVRLDGGVKLVNRNTWLLVTLVSQADNITEQSMSPSLSEIQLTISVVVPVAIIFIIAVSLALQMRRKRSKLEKDAIVILDYGQKVVPKKSNDVEGCGMDLQEMAVISIPKEITFSKEIPNGLLLNRSNGQIFPKNLEFNKIFSATVDLLKNPLYTVYTVHPMAGLRIFKHCAQVVIKTILILDFFIFVIFPNIGFASVFMVLD
ncbi:hypothetical protein CHS0354_040093 [Potamilus streckersoni]|uniref:Uncharacterized protein n=1 Tax=Potamilus streckersoni TaxID=2493646 RepID=A0AAE0STF9_9BIVA|nr:hypothetical protein CHS0354_040093 [Potamilus streckersoni]